MQVSRRLIAAVKLAQKPAYVIARRAGLRPELLSKLLHGAIPLRPRDSRVVAVAKAVGVPVSEAFETRSEPRPAG